MKTSGISSTEVVSWIIVVILTLQVLLSVMLIIRINQLYRSLAHRDTGLLSLVASTEQNTIAQRVSADDNLSKGPATAPVTIIEFSDFECPYCARAADALQRIMVQYPGKIRLVYRHFPLERVHANALEAALSAECAAEQGKFWLMHDWLFDHQTALTPAEVLRYASAIGLDEAAFVECREAETTLAKVRKDQRDGEAYGVQGTPTFFVNGHMIVGMSSYEQLQSVVERTLSKQ